MDYINAPIKALAVGEEIPATKKAAEPSPDFGEESRWNSRQKKAMLARDKAETEKLAATDPAVVAGYMTFKIISLSEKL